MGRLIVVTVFAVSCIFVAFDELMDILIEEFTRRLPR